MPDGNPKPVDGVCPCCRKRDSHEQPSDDEDTEDERAQQEYPNVQPYLQMLHDVGRSIDDSNAKIDDAAQMLSTRRIPCAGNNCPARFQSLCSVRSITLPHGNVRLECPCNNICFTLNCVNCNSNEAKSKKAGQKSKQKIPNGKGKSPKSSHKTRDLLHNVNIGLASRTIHNPYSIQQQDNANDHDSSSCSSPILLRKKAIPVVLAHAPQENVNINSDDETSILIDSSDEETQILIDSSDDETAILIDSSDDETADV
jgi:hypothetical protein